MLHNDMLAQCTREATSHPDDCPGKGSGRSLGIGHKELDIPIRKVVGSC